MMSLPIPFGNPYTYAGHSGVDFPQPRGTVFRASGPGTVSFRSKNERGGNMVWVDYDGYPGVAYAHLDNYDLTPPQGTRVKEGDALGRVGMSGNTTGPHLHVEVYGNATTAGFWKFFDRNRVVQSSNPSGGSTPVTPNNPAPAGAKEEEEMKPFIVTLPQGRWALIIPQGNAKPRAVSLQGNAGAAATALFGQPIPFDQTAAAGWLAQAVDGI